MSTEDTLDFISRQFHIYFGLCVLIFGVIGGIFNIIIFTTLKTFRETSCAFYLTIVSIVNIGQLLTALFIRVLSEGFHTDIRRLSWVCKVQTYLVTWFTLISFTGMCFATIDQYISMSKYRNFSNLRFAQRCIFIICIFWALFSISAAIYWDAPAGRCTIINLSFAIYAARFHFPILIGFLPISIMIIFSLLAFNSVRTLGNQRINIVRLSRDRQLTAMTLIHVIFVIITTLPFTIFYIYSSTLTIKDPEQIARNNLIYGITVLIYYSSFAGSFYIYCCVSERFRKQFIYVLMKVCMNQRPQWINNQIMPNRETIVDGQPTRNKESSIRIVTIS